MLKKLNIISKKRFNNKHLNMNSGDNKLKYKFFSNIANCLENCSLHGFQYVINKKYNTRTSICWMLILMTSFAFCFYMIFLQLNRFQESAVLNTISSTGYPVWKNPFPSVVICNNNAVYKNNSKRIIKELVAKGVKESDALEFLANLSNLILCIHCEEIEVNFNVTKQIQIEKNIQSIGYDVDTLMKKLAHPCENMITRCIWKSEEKSCANLFRSVKTTMGYCCAFNYFGITKYQDRINESLFSGGFGVNSGLQVMIDVEPDQYMSITNTVPGVDVLVGHGLQYAEFGSHSHSIIPGYITNLGVDPSIFMGNRDLKYLKDVTRACWFNQEGTLKWTKIYNQLTCFNECKANYMLKICNCIPFYYANGNEKICTFEEFSCLVNNKSLFSSLMLTDLKEDSKYIQSTDMSGAEFCYCLPNCDDIHYAINKDQKYTKLDNSTCGLNVYFNNIAGILRIRTVHVTWDTLIAIIGGIFGLCMGGSVITLFELLFLLFQSIFRKPSSEEHKNLKDNLNTNGFNTFSL